MTTTFEIKTGATWVDVTTYVASATFSNPGRAALNKLEVTFSKDIRDTTEDPTFEKEIRITVDSSIIFGGLIEKPKTSAALVEVTAYSYGAEFLDRLVNEVYENQSPEYIFEDIITNKTNLTYASSETSGITITKIAFKDQTVAEVFRTLSELLGWVFYTDYQKNAYFEPEGQVDTGIIYEIGGNDVLGKPTWEYNNNNVVNKIIVEGETQNFDNNETPDTFTASASQTTFTLTNVPSDNLKVTVDGAVQDPKVDGSSDGDFTVFREKKQVIFETGLTGGETVVITYNYNIPVKVTRQVPTDGLRRERKVKLDSIKTQADARRYAREYLAIYSTPNKEAKLVVQGYNTDVSVGNKITVVDSYENPEINETFVVRKLTYSYQTNTTEYSIGTDTYLIWDWQREVMDRLKKIQNENENTELIQESPYVQERYTIDYNRKQFGYTRDINDSWIWGTAVWGVDKWGDRRTGDNFESYESGSYSVSDFWTISGGPGSITDGKYTIVGGESLTYKGRDGTGSYTISDGKLDVQIEPTTARLQFIVRYIDADNYVFIEVTSTGVSLKERVSGTTTELDSVSISLTGAQDIYFRFDSDSILVLDKNGLWSLTGTTSVSSQVGNIVMTNDSAPGGWPTAFGTWGELGESSVINYIEIYNGDN